MTSKSLETIDFSVATLDHFDELSTLLGICFAEEPSTKGCSIDPPLTAKDWSDICNEFLVEGCTNGLSPIAIDRSTQKIIGTFACWDFFSPVSDKFKHLEKTLPRLTALECAITLLDDAFMDNHPEYNQSSTPGKVMDLLFLGVHPDYTGLGLSRILTERALELVRKSNYEYAVMECTGFFSQRTAIACGFTKVISVPYTDVIVDGKAVFANCEPPHTKWEFYEMCLK